MSIFTDSYSFFKKRRHQVVFGWRMDHFYASWPLLRQRAEMLTEKPHKILNHWQRDLYACRRRGFAKKGGKGFPKNYKRSVSKGKSAFRWYTSSLPLH